MSKLTLILFLLCTMRALATPATFTPNDVRDDRIRAYAFTGAIVMVDPVTRIENAVLLIRNGEVVDVGDDVKIPPEYTEIELDGRMIFPAFIDLHSNYGLPAVKKTKGPSYSDREVIGPQTPGAYSANDSTFVSIPSPISWKDTSWPTKWWRMLREGRRTSPTWSSCAAPGHAKPCQRSSKDFPVARRGNICGYLRQHHGPISTFTPGGWQ